MNFWEAKYRNGADEDENRLEISVLRSQTRDIFLNGCYILPYPAPAKMTLDQNGSSNN
jgi:hypothetical protein